MLAVFLEDRVDLVKVELLLLEELLDLLQLGQLMLEIGAETVIVPFLKVYFTALSKIFIKAAFNFGPSAFTVQLPSGFSNFK